MRAAYEPQGLVWTTPLGFDNSFALVIRGDDAKRLGIKMPPEVPMFGQERAYTSPIWYTPKA